MSEESENQKLKRKIARLEQTINGLEQKMKKVQQREELLNIMAEKSFAGAYVSQDGKFKFGSWNTFSFAGYTIKDLLGVKADSLIHPEDRDTVKANARAMLRGERTAPYEFRVVTRGGQIRWMLETVTQIVYEGQPAILGNSMDITERNLAEDARRESERRLVDIIEFLPDATVVINCEGEVIAWNRAMEKMTGVSAKDMVGKGNYEYSIPFYGDRRPVIVDLVLKPNEELEKKYLGFDRQKYELVVETWVPGIPAYVWGKASPLYDNNGHIVGAIAVLRDITARKLAEDALRESERRLSDIIEFLPDATMVINCEGEVIAWNRAMEKMTGVSAKNMLGKGNYEYSIPFFGDRRPVIIDLVLKPNEELEKRYSGIDRQKNEYVVETWVPGVNAYVWAKAGPLFDNKANIIGAIEIIRDVTKRKLAEEAVIKRERELEIKSNELEELNTALTVLLKRRGDDRKELEETLVLNINELVIPYVEELKRAKIDDRSMTYINILESNLKNILSPFSQRLSVKYLSLTNREVRVAELIKEGKSSKEVAELLNVTESSVNINRYRLRKKLALKKQDNLRVYLTSLP
ncbi:MAG: hypothetical protein CVU52_07555 [Deltaproteobacteria bacterium HGW-Deltaproteobacteria-10]|nr:MAG: hypothetical protein CVU52_07555 [Deltaproteobacteria bacterium HGW-Deltaproteobacteria-10]